MSEASLPAPHAAIAAPIPLPPGGGGGLVSVGCFNSGHDALVFRPPLSHQTEVEIGSIDVEDAVPFPVVVVMIWQYMAASHSG